ncbi:MAG TPA: hypothetical protein PKH77_21415, partial [Anaerolineae bacterium]|nr:hypothetical protein [Anaerolineae bacterium]
TSAPILPLLPIYFFNVHQPLLGRYFFVGGLRSPPTKKYPLNRAFRRKSRAKTNFRTNSWLLQDKLK